MVTALSNPGYGIKLKISTKAKLFVMKSKFKKMLSRLFVLEVVLGIPLKNIKKLNGKPLIYWCLSKLVKINEIDRLIVSTDDKKIKKVVRKFFQKIEILDRPARLADDKSTLTEVVKYVSNQIKTSTFQPDYILQIARHVHLLKMTPLKSDKKFSL